mgnify:FL=1
MIPDSAEITVERNTIRWENDDFSISEDEAASISDAIRDHLESRRIDSVLVDNRDASGTWPAEVNEYWTSLMQEMYEQGIDCATVSPSVTNTMQINRLASDGGMDDRVKAFSASDYDDALAFLGIDG